MGDPEKENQTGYFRHARTDVVPFMPDHLGRVLEVGCGEAQTLRLMGAQNRYDWAGGVELNEGAASVASSHLDQVWQGDAEALAQDIQVDPVDTLVCLDILEHLVDPWTTLDRYVALLKPGGMVVISLPNIQYYKVAGPLLMKGRFDYEDAGVMDRTHLRWFVHDTAVELVKGAGLDVVAFHHLIKLKPWRLRWVLDRISGGLLRDLMAPQFVLIGKKPD